MKAYYFTITNKMTNEVIYNSGYFHSLDELNDAQGVMKTHLSIEDYAYRGFVIW